MTVFLRRFKPQRPVNCLTSDDDPSPLAGQWHLLALQWNNVSWTTRTGSELAVFPGSMER